MPWAAAGPNCLPGTGPPSPRKFAENWPAGARPRQVGGVTTLRHIDALLGTTWVWDEETDEERLAVDDLRAEVDAMLDALVFDQG